MLCLVWHPKLQQHQIHLNSCRNEGTCQMGSKKAEAFQVKEAKCHKCNYDKCTRTVALEVGDMVLVHITTFKGCHKIQDRWENREYVVEKWLYPNVPVYVVHPRDGCSQTLQRNYLLPINSNKGQDEKAALMAGVENNSTSTPTPPVDSEPADAGPSGMVTPSTAGNTPQGSLAQSAPLRHSVWKNQNQLPWRYWNFSLLADTTLSSIWDAWIGLCILSVHRFLGKYSVNNTLLVPSCVCQALLSFGIEGNSFNVISMMDLWMVGEWTKDYLAQVQLPHCEIKFQNSIPIET